MCDGFNPYCVLSCFPWFPVKIDAHVEPGTYATGTVIDVGVNVTNKSFRSIRSFTVQLIKVTTKSLIRPFMDFDSLNF